MKAWTIVGISVALASLVFGCGREVADLPFGEGTLANAGSGAADPDTGTTVIVDPADGSRPVDGPGEPRDDQEPPGPHFDPVLLLDRLVSAYEEHNLQKFDELLSEDYIFIGARGDGTLFSELAESIWDKDIEVSVHRNLFDSEYVPSVGLREVDRIGCEIRLLDCRPCETLGQEEWWLDCMGDWVLWTLPQAARPFAVRHTCEFSLLVCSDAVDSSSPVIRVWRDKAGTVRFLYPR